MRNFYKRIFIGLTVLIIAGTTLLPLTGCKKQEKVIKIGILYPLTGDASYWGKNARDGALLAVKHFSPTNKLKGYKIVPIIEDSKSNPKAAVSAVNKLIHRDNVKFIVGDLASSNLLAILPIVNENRVLCIGQGSSPLIKKAGDYVFRTFPSDDFQGLVIAKFLRDYIKVSAKNTGILYINNEYGEGVKNVIIQKLGKRFRIIESYPPKTRDFKNIIYKVQRLDALVIIGYPEEIVILLKQLDEIGFKGIVVGTETFENEKIKELSLHFPIYYSVPKLGDISDPIVKKFQEDFESSYKRKPGVPADMAYDAMMLILKAIDSVGYNPDDVIKFLYGIKNYHGASGIITFDKYGDVVKPFVIKSVKERKSKIVWEWQP